MTNINCLRPEIVGSLPSIGLTTFFNPLAPIAIPVKLFKGSKGGGNFVSALPEARKIIEDISSMTSGNDISVIGREGLESFIDAEKLIQKEITGPAYFMTGGYKGRIALIWSELGKMYRRTIESLINQFSPVLTQHNPAAVTEALAQFQQYLDYLTAMGSGNKLKSQPGYNDGNAIGKNFTIRLKQYAESLPPVPGEEESTGTSMLPLALGVGAAGLGLYLMLR